MSQPVRRDLAGGVWEVAEPDPDRQQLWSKELDLPAPAVQVLLNRGIHELDEARRFLLAGPEHLHAPSLMAGMDQAVARLARAIEARERIRIYGDYDADGVTGTALLLLFLRGLGASVDFYIPSRLDEGYGLSGGALEEARNQGVDLVVSVDCGITSLAEARRAEGIGLDLIITDHHEPLDELPRAVAVLDPKRRDCPYPFKDLAGVGVAYKLATALAARYGRPEPMEYLDLVALGTVGDVVSLRGENRDLVKGGLPLIGQGLRLGLRALVDLAGLGGKPITAEGVAFGLVPRINAIGRIGDAREAVALLISDDWAEACARAARLDAENRSRQQIEAAVLEEARAWLAAHPEEAAGPAIVLSSPSWHVGVVGLVAARLLELYHRPVVILTEGPDGEARGSARSMPGVNIFEALKACDGATSRFGGHELAAGVAIPAGGLDRFRETFRNAVAQLTAGAVPRPRVAVDAEVPLDVSDQRLAQALARFAPFGTGNPPPLFASRGVEVIEARRVGQEGNHLRLRIRQGKRMLEAIGFNLGSAMEMVGGRPIDLLYTPELNEWNGRRRVQLVVRHLCPSDESGLKPAEALFGKGKPDAWPATPSTPTPPPPTIVVDRRGHPDRSAALVEILSRARLAVIAVNNRWTAGAIEARLVQLQGADGVQSADRPGGLAGRVYVIGSIHGHQVIRSVQPVHPEAGARGSAALVLYHPPFSQGHLAHLTRVARAAVGPGSDPVEVDLLYGPADVRLSEVILARQSPDRSALVEIYRTLRELAPYGTPLALAGLFRRLSGPWERERALVGLTILEELGLLKRIIAADGESLILSKPTPGVKLDLEASDTYRRGRLAGQAFAAHAAEVLSAAPETLVALAWAPGKADERLEERGAV